MICEYIRCPAFKRLDYTNPICLELLLAFSSLTSCSNSFNTNIVWWWQQLVHLLLTKGYTQFGQLVLKELNPSQRQSSTLIVVLTLLLSLVQHYIYHQHYSVWMWSIIRQYSQSLGLFISAAKTGDLCPV